MKTLWTKRHKLYFAKPVTGLSRVYRNVIPVGPLTTTPGVLRGEQWQCLLTKGPKCGRISKYNSRDIIIGKPKPYGYDQGQFPKLKNTFIDA